MNLASVSTISYADSNDGIFVLVGSLGCINPKIVGPECPSLRTGSLIELEPAGLVNKNASVPILLLLSIKCKICQILIVNYKITM
jgi:hypothetical protein